MRWEEEIAAAEAIRIARVLEAGDLRRARALSRRLTERQKRIIGRWASARRNR